MDVPDAVCNSAIKHKRNVSIVSISPRFPTFRSLKFPPKSLRCSSSQDAHGAHAAASTQDVSHTERSASRCLLLTFVGRINLRPGAGNHRRYPDRGGEYPPYVCSHVCRADGRVCPGGSARWLRRLHPGGKSVCE